MARPKTGRNGKRVSLYLNTEIRVEGTKIARHHHRLSFSKLVEHLINKERIRIAKEARRRGKVLRKIGRTA